MTAASKKGSTAHAGQPDAPNTTAGPSKEASVKDVDKQPKNTKAAAKKSTVPQQQESAQLPTQPEQQPAAAPAAPAAPAPAAPPAPKGQRNGAKSQEVAQHGPSAPAPVAPPAAQPAAHELDVLAPVPKPTGTTVDAKAFIMLQVRC